MTFKVGDTVRRINGANNGMHTGDLGVVGKIMPDGVFVTPINPIRPGATAGQHDSDNLELVVTKNHMNLSEKFALAFKGEPEKSFIKAGVMNADETLTSDGTQLFLAYLLQKHGADFKTTVIDPILEAEKNA